MALFCVIMLSFQHIVDGSTCENFGVGDRCNSHGRCMWGTAHGWSFEKCVCDEGYITHPSASDYDFTAEWCNYEQKSQTTAFSLHFFFGVSPAFYVAPIRFQTLRAQFRMVGSGALLCRELGRRRFSNRTTNCWVCSAFFDFGWPTICSVLRAYHMRSICLVGRRLRAFRYE